MSCPLCYSPSEFLIKADQREYHLCASCRLIFVPSRFFITHEKEIERYLEHLNVASVIEAVLMFEVAVDFFFMGNEKTGTGQR